MSLLDKLKTDLSSFDYSKIGQKHDDYFGEDNATGFTPNRQEGRNSIWNGHNCESEWVYYTSKKYSDLIIKKSNN